ncbi:MAG: DNA helicase PcrA [bacterium]|nr:DNA helicase PcrA [bacterium]
MSIYDSLNPKQKEAVLHTEGPLLVLAGAGSGKTRVLTHRIAYLIEEKAVNPWNIMAITFTNKAAQEMRERVDKLIGFGSESIWVSTFHSSCVRILRRHIEPLGFDTNFTIYDTDDQKTLMKQVIKKLNLDPKMYKEKAMLGYISKAKDELISPKEFMEQAEGDYRKQQIAQIYKEYQTMLKENNALDFDDLIVKTVELFQANPDILEHYQRRFRYIMVDEYQDTNYAQFKLVELLASKYYNLCVVGDDDQSIYKFRGADIKNILNFEESFSGAAVIKLEQNYRSTQNILNAANGVIHNNEGRKDKTLWTANEEGERLHLRQFDTAQDEARFIAEDIADSGEAYPDCAVLYRTNAQSRLVEEQCIVHNIPYRLVGGINFYQRKEIKDILCYLKTIANGKDGVAVQRILNVPKRGIGAASITKVMNYAEEQGISFYEALQEADEIAGLGKTAAKIAAFVHQITVFRSKLEYLSMQELIEDVLESTGYRKEIKDGDDPVESESRLENIEELISKAASYDMSEDEPTLDGFLEQVALVADIDNMDDTENRVVLMTLHSAKGLEFPRVYLCGMEEGLFPSYMSIMALNSEGKNEEIEEERRLCYVGITRAKRVLTLTSAKQRMVNGETRYSRWSRFVEEIPPLLLDATTNPKKKEFASYVSRPNAYARTTQTTQAPTAYSTPYSASSTVGFGKTFTVSKQEDLGYQVQDRVFHIKYGEGTVLNIEDAGKDYEVTVDFDRTGVRKIFASFAKLKKVNR